MYIKIDINRLINLLLRTTTLGTRFMFIFFIAKFLDPATVGYYGLFTATVGYTIYFVGLDFYTYSTREILQFPANQRGPLLKAQGTLSVGLYIFVVPVALMLMSRTDLPSILLWWFAPIMVLEHFNQEMSRLLIALSEQITASLVLFLRQGSWAIAVVALMVWTPESRHLQMVFALWATSGIFAAALGLWKLRQLDTGGWRGPLDWRWIRRGIIVSLGFLISTLALRAIQTIDRYWLEALGGIEMVGVYVLFMGVAGSLLTFLDAGIFAFTYPDLIRYNHQHDFERARSLVRKSLFQTFAVVTAFGAVSWLLLPYLLDWIGNPLYRAEIGLFPWILSAMMLNAIGMIPHYGLYARGFDKHIIISHIAALVIFVATTWAFSQTRTTLAVPLGLNMSFLLILIWKSSAYLYLIAPRKGGDVVRSSP